MKGHTMSLSKLLSVFGVCVVALFQSTQSRAEVLPRYQVSVLIDTSGSMGFQILSTEIARVRYATFITTRLIHDLSYRTQYSLQIYTWSTNLHTPPLVAHDINTEEDAFLAEHDLIRNSFESSGLTPTGSVLGELIEYIAEEYSQCARHVVIILTDDPPDDRTVFAEFSAQAHEYGYALGVVVVPNHEMYEAYEFFSAARHTEAYLYFHRYTEDGFEEFLETLLSSAQLPHICFTG